MMPGVSLFELGWDGHFGLLSVMLEEVLHEERAMRSGAVAVSTKKPHGPPAKDKRTQKVLARYYDEIKAKQPGKSKEYYARVAWQRYCMYKNPENPSCGPAGKSKDVTTGPKAEDEMSLDAAFETALSGATDLAERKPGAHDNPYAGSEVDREKKNRSRNPRRSSKGEKKAASKAARRGAKKDIDARMQGEDLDVARMSLLSLSEEARPGQFFVVVDTSKPGGKQIGSIYKGAKAADAAAQKLWDKGNKKIQVIDALWYGPTREKMKKSGMIGESVDLDLHEHLSALVTESPEADVSEDPITEGRRPTSTDIKKKAVFYLKLAVKPTGGQTYMDMIRGDLQDVMRGKADDSIAKHYVGWTKADIKKLIGYLSPSQRGQKAPSKMGGRQAPQATPKYEKPAVGGRGGEEVVRVGEFRARVDGAYRKVNYDLSQTVNQSELENWLRIAISVRDELARTTTKRGKPRDYERKEDALARLNKAIKGVQTGKIKRKDHRRDRGAVDGNRRSNNVIPFRRESVEESMDPLTEARTDLLGEARTWRRAAATKKPAATGAFVAIWIGDSDHSAGAWPLEKWQQAVKTAKDIRKAGEKAYLGYIPSKSGTRPSHLLKGPAKIPSSLMVEELSADVLSLQERSKVSAEQYVSSVAGIRRGIMDLSDYTAADAKAKTNGLVVALGSRIGTQLAQGRTVEVKDPGGLFAYALDQAKRDLAKEIQHFMVFEFEHDAYLSSMEDPSDYAANAHEYAIKEAKKAKIHIKKSGTTYKIWMTPSPSEISKKMWKEARFTSKYGKKQHRNEDVESPALAEITESRSALLGASEDPLDEARGALLGEGINRGGVAGTCQMPDYYELPQGTDGTQTGGGRAPGLGGMNAGGIEGAPSGWYRGHFERISRVSQGDTVNVGPYRFEVKQTKHEPGMVKLILASGDGGLRDQFEMVVPETPTQHLSLVDYGGRSKDFGIGDVTQPNVRVESLDENFHRVMGKPGGMNSRAGLSAGGQLGTLPRSESDPGEVASRALLAAQQSVETFMAARTNKSWRAVYAAPTRANNLFMGKVVRQVFECDGYQAEVNVSTRMQGGKYPVTVRCRKMGGEWEEQSMRLTAEELGKPSRLMGAACKTMMS